MMFLSRSGRAELFYSGISTLLYRDLSQLGENWFELRGNRKSLLLKLKENGSEVKKNVDAEGGKDVKDAEGAEKVE